MAEVIRGDFGGEPGGTVCVARGPDGLRPSRLNATARRGSAVLGRGRPSLARWRRLYGDTTVETAGSLAVLAEETAV